MSDMENIYFIFESASMGSHSTTLSFRGVCVCVCALRCNFLQIFEHRLHTGVKQDSCRRFTSSSEGRRRVTAPLLCPPPWWCPPLGVKSCRWMTSQEGLGAGSSSRRVGADVHSNTSYLLLAVTQNDRIKPETQVTLLFMRVSHKVNLSEFS